MSYEKNISVVGCGHWGKNLVRNISELGALHSISDYSDDLANAFSEQYDVPALKWDEIIESEEVRAVILAVPAPLHFEYAKAALEAGKDVYVEKPICLKNDEAQKLCEIAEGKNSILMVGHLLQYHPVFLKLRDMVRNGDLGTVKYIYSNRLSLGKIRREENVLWSFAPHDVSMILSLAGDHNPVWVDANGSSHTHGTIEDYAHVKMRFSNGVGAHINVSWLNPFKEQKLVVVGEKGMAVFDDQALWQEKLALYSHNIEVSDDVPKIEKADPIYIDVEQSEPLRNECTHFLECIKTRNKPRTDGREGLSVLKVLNEAENSMKEKRGAGDKKVNYFVHESAYVDEPSTIGQGTKIWHFSHVLPNTKIGEGVNIGQNCVLGPHVQVGNNCKIQNNVSVYKGVHLEDGVFCGPSCVFTNVNNPRAEVSRKDEFRETRVKRGATIGANATIVCGHTLGAYCFIAAGAVVTNDVPDHALMAGVPAKRIGWMSHAGAKLGDDLVCPIEKKQYEVTDQGLKEK